MKVVAAPNAFKGSLSAFEAAAAIAAGVRRARPGAEVSELAIADGGDGTAEVLCRAGGGSFREQPACDALERPLHARFAWLPDGTAVIDVATASGLARLASHELRPLAATSYGTGQLLRAALEAGARRIVLGVGGSASVDAGAGLLQALGVRLLDAEERELSRGGAALAQLARLDASGVVAAARSVPIDVACDVDSPLLGPEGAARLFGPQKGATPAMVEQLEASLAHFAAVLERDLGRAVTQVRGGGAAGGIAAGLYGVLGARLVPGIDLVLDQLGFERALDGAVLCITGEGRLDRQSLRHKGPLGVARRAAARGVPVLAIAGEIPSDVSLRDFPELIAILGLREPGMSRELAMQQAGRLLEAAAEQAVRQALHV
jgi:glycerate kinase